VSPAAPAREILLFLFLGTVPFTEDINSRPRVRGKKNEGGKRRRSRGAGIEGVASQAHPEVGGKKMEAAPPRSRMPDVSN